MRIEDCPLQKAVLDDGTEIHYVEAGNGTPIVFVHGGFGDWSSWSTQWPVFTMSHRCFSYSRRFSSPNLNTHMRRDHSAIHEAQDLLELLNTWGLDAPILVGTSYGAYTALMMSLDAPGRVRALAITEPPVLPLADLVPGGREARLAFENCLALGVDAYARGQDAEAVRLLTVSINGDAPQPATSEEGLRKRLRNAYAMKVLCESLDPYPAIDLARLRTLDVPTLLTSGVNTPAVHEAVFRSLAHLLPRAQVLRVPDAGHGVHRDNPHAFNMALSRFIEGLP